MARSAAKDPEKAAARFAKELCPSDRRVAEDGPPEEKQMTFFTEALHDGPGGVIDDYRALAQPWGFDLPSITYPISVWQGSEDTLVAAIVGEYIATQIPSATLRRFPGEGHLLVLPHAAEALAIATGLG